MDDNGGRDDAGSRDLDYGHTFGTQRDRSKGEETGYYENYSDGWIDALPDVGEHTDAGLEAAVRHRLATFEDATDITVKVEKGEVTLTGTVGDERTAHRAEKALSSLAGVKRIHNELRVKG